MPRSREQLHEIVVTQPVHVHVSIVGVPAPLSIRILKKIDGGNRRVRMREVVAVIDHVNEETVIPHNARTFFENVREHLRCNVLENRVRRVEIDAGLWKRCLRRVAILDVVDAAQLEKKGQRKPTSPLELKQLREALRPEKITEQPGDMVLLVRHILKRFLDQLTL